MGQSSKRFILHEIEGGIFVTFYEKYLMMCNEHGVSPSAAALQAGTTRTAVSRWKRGSMPTDATILMLADFFGCKPKDLLPDNEEELSPKEDTTTDTLDAERLERLKEDERTLLDAYRTMDDAGRFAMQVFAKAVRKGNAD